MLPPVLRHKEKRKIDHNVFQNGGMKIMLIVMLKLANYKLEVGEHVAFIVSNCLL